jgi:hypothetical protein
MLLTVCPLKKSLSVIVTKSWWKVDDNNSLLVGDPQGILGQQLRPAQSAYIILLMTLIIRYSIKFLNVMKLWPSPRVEMGV